MCGCEHHQDPTKLCTCNCSGTDHADVERCMACWDPVIMIVQKGTGFCCQRCARGLPKDGAVQPLSMATMT